MSETLTIIFEDESTLQVVSPPQINILEIIQEEYEVVEVRVNGRKYAIIVG